MEATTTKPSADGVSARVVDALAVHANTDPLDLKPLYDVIDPDALESIVGRDGDDVRVSFEYDEHVVTVSGDGTVSVDGCTYDDPHAEVLGP